MVSGMASVVAARCGFYTRALLACALSARVLLAQPQPISQPDARQLVELANQSRAAAGLPALKWDAALAGAAYDHALRMAHEGPIAHRYGGEPDLPERAAAAGAHFSLIEENIAVGNSPAQIHDGWMHSQGHHDNLLNAKIDHIGVALVPANGVLYAVADYAQSVTAMTQAQVEAKIGAILHGRGLTLVADAAGARRYCSLDEGMSGSDSGVKARFMMRWQSADIAKLPPELEQRVASGQFKQAAVGACDAKSSGESSQPVFTAYRVAVLMY
jgi:hypothetical protein